MGRLRIKLGATGKYPRGMLNPQDEGELQLMISSDETTRLVRIDFGKPVAWLVMNKEESVRLAEGILEHARRLL